MPKYPMYLGVKLTKSENNALLKMARQTGLHKSLYARLALRDKLIAQGALTIYNPAPEADEITAQVNHD
jgi:hypothetical protein